MSKCTECKEYDKEKHYCPKWCDVIKATIENIRAYEREKVLEEVLKILANEKWDYTLVNKIEQLKEKK